MEYKKFELNIRDNIRALKNINKNQQDIFFNGLEKKSEKNLTDVKKIFFESLKPKERLSSIHNACGILLRIFDQICRTHNLSYWIMAGTLIGAVRTGNPIPWDDDFDIGMTAGDYYKFFDLVNNGVSPHIHLEITPIFKLGRLHFKHIIRFKCNEGTISSTGRGAFIDIFIHNYCDDVSPGTLKSMKEFRKGIRLYLYNTYHKELSKYTDTKTRSERIIQILKDDADLIFEEKYFTSGDRSKGALAFSTIASTGWFTEKFSFPSSYIFPLKDINYCDFKVMAPNECEKSLKESYGDIYYLPNDILTHKHITKSNYENHIASLKDVISEIKKQYGW